MLEAGHPNTSLSISDEGHILVCRQLLPVLHTAVEMRQSFLTPLKTVHQSYLGDLSLLSRPPHLPKSPLANFVTLGAR